MPDIRFIDFLKTLKPGVWNKIATREWTVKDVVAHMIGWGRGDVEQIKEIWRSQEPPAWKKSGWSKADDDAYNAKWVRYYKDYTPQQLRAEWEYWHREVQKAIDEIGEEKLRVRMDLFDWLFEGVEDNRKDTTPGHYKHHYEQIKRIINSN